MMVDAIGLIVYIVMLWSFNKFDLGIKFTALTIGIAPVLLNGIYRAIMASIYHKSLNGLFAPYEIIAAVVQLVFAFIIVRLLERNEESIGAWFTVAIIGGAVSYAFVPSFAQLLVGLV
jgi:hypothetical protein